MYWREANTETSFWFKHALEELKCLWNICTSAKPFEMEECIDYLVSEILHQKLIKQLNQFN